MLMSTNVVHTSSSTSTSVLVEETVTIKEVNQITGQVTTTSTDIQVIQSQENQVFIAEIVHQIPTLVNVVPTVVQTSVFGEFIEKIFVIEQHESIVQVTTLYNATS